MKPKKTFTVHTDPLKVKRRILELEAQLKKVQGPEHPFDYKYEEKNEIKEELNALYRLRYKQKNYTKPPVKTKVRGL